MRRGLDNLHNIDHQAYVCVMYLCMYVCIRLHSSNCMYVCIYCIYLWLHVSSTPLRERMYDMQCIYACMQRCILHSLIWIFMKSNNCLFASSETTAPLVYMISLETCAPALVPPARAAARTRYAQAAAGERTWIHVCMVMS